jgi:hypothetical protein
VTVAKDEEPLLREFLKTLAVVVEEESMVLMSLHNGILEMEALAAEEEDLEVQELTSQKAYQERKTLAVAAAAVDLVTNLTSPAEAADLVL